MPAYGCIPAHSACFLLIKNTTRNTEHIPTQDISDTHKKAKNLIYSLRSSCVAQPNNVARTCAKHLGNAQGKTFEGSLPPKGFDPDLVRVIHAWDMHARTHAYELTHGPRSVLNKNYSQLKLFWSNVCRATPKIRNNQKYAKRRYYTLSSHLDSVPVTSQLLPKQRKVSSPPPFLAPKTGG